MMLDVLATFAVVALLLAGVFRAMTARSGTHDKESDRRSASPLAPVAAIGLALVAAAAVTYVVIFIVLPLIVVALVLRAVRR